MVCLPEAIFGLLSGEPEREDRFCRLHALGLRHEYYFNSYGYALITGQFQFISPGTDYAAATRQLQKELKIESPSFTKA